MYISMIHEIVKKLKRKFRTSNPYEIADALGIEIIYKKFDSMKGMYTLRERCPFIFLSNDLDEYMEKIVLFHEIGHHVLHRHEVSSTFSSFSEHSLYDMSSKYEIEANIFAANFIISDKDVYRIEEGCTTENATRTLCVPHEMLLIKINDMNERGCDFNIPYIPKSSFLA